DGSRAGQAVLDPEPAAILPEARRAAARAHGAVQAAALRSRRNAKSENLCAAGSAPTHYGWRSPSRGGPPVPERPLQPLLRHLRRRAESEAACPLTDRQLLERFTAGRDPSAFAALVGRHGPLVLAACRRVLADEADVEDAFQATFLVLLRK